MFYSTAFAFLYSMTRESIQYTQCHIFPSLRELSKVWNQPFSLHFDGTVTGRQKLVKDRLDPDVANESLLQHTLNA